MRVLTAAQMREVDRRAGIAVRAMEAVAQRAGAVAARRI
jgi:hypothetical protein